MKAMMAIAAFAALATMGLIEGVARADTSPATGVCASHEASVYFPKGASDLSSYSRTIIDRLAAAARACGRAQVTVAAPAGGFEAARAAAVSQAFAANGVRVVVVRASLSADESAAGNVLDRAARVRVQLAPPNS